MISAGRQRALVALAVVASLAFVVAAHASMTRGLSPAVGAALSLVPVAIVLLLVLRRGARAVALALFALAGIALWLGWESLQRHFSDVLFLEHAGFNLALAIAFGRTLTGGREPLVTRFARIVHEGKFPPGVERYTRGLTVAWTVFFSTLFVASCALYLGGFPDAWSLLANILSPLLVTAMFVVEYAVRHRVFLPDVEPVGILTGARAFMNHVQATRARASH